MAKFVKVPSQDGKQTFFVNADRVTWVMPHPNDSGKCTLWFDREHSLNIGEGAAVFADDAHGR
jgi:hypothetical protein